MNAYAAKAAIMIGMIVAGSVIAMLLTNARPMLLSVDHLAVVGQRPLVASSGDFSAVHQPVAFAASAVAQRGDQQADDGDDPQEADRRAATSLTSQLALPGVLAHALVAVALPGRVGDRAR